MKKIIYTIVLLYVCAVVANAQIPGTWTVNPSNYNYSMQVTSKLNQTCVDLNDANNAIAAFVGTQCRGVAYSNVTAGTNLLALLVINSNSIAGERVTFQIYNSASNTVFWVKDTITFSNGAQRGTLASPVLMTNNYPPTKITLSTYTFLENITIGSTIATLTATDNDVPNSFTFTLPSGALENSKYSIAGNNLQANSTYSYNADPKDTIRIRVTDAGGCPYTEDVILFINDQNDAPTDIQFSADTLNDQDPAGTFVGKLTTTDSDPLDTHTYTFGTCTPGADSTSFVIRNDSVFAKIKILHDVKPLLNICIRTTDAGGLFYEESFQIPIKDSFDPTDILIDTLSVKEGNSEDFYLSKIRTVDNDSNDSFTYALVAGAGDEDNAQFYIVGDKLYIKNTTNYDVKISYSIRVKTSDAKGASFEKSFTITVLDDPTISLPLPSLNYLSPNDDGKNDFWVIDNVQIYKEYSLQIFDQFGFIVYQKDSNYNNEWDGKLNGKALPDGNYYYVFKNDKKTYKGNLTLVNQ